MKKFKFFNFLCLRGVLGPILGGFWLHFGALGPSWGASGGLVGDFGGPWGASGALGDAPWEPWGGSWDPLGALLAHFGFPRVDLGAIWGRFCGRLGMVWGRFLRDFSGILD